MVPGLMMQIREETPADAAAIRAVHAAAFGKDAEAELVDRIRVNGAAALSLVAEKDGEIVGHALFTPVLLGTNPRPIEGMGLGPVAVLPSCQKRGIGSRLIKEGARWLHDYGCPYIVVLGSPQFYPRFGFEPASRFHVRCEWEVPEDAFMLMPLDRRALQACSGLVRYREEFAALA
jgi:putative acetyltransferase